MTRMTWKDGQRERSEPLLKKHRTVGRLASLVMGA